MNYLPTCTSRLVVHPCQVSLTSMQRCRSSEDKLKCVKILSVKVDNSVKTCRTSCNYLPTCTSRLGAQHPCQVSFKFMQGCRSSEDKLKCVKILSVKVDNSVKTCRTSCNYLPTCTSRLGAQHPCQVSFKFMQGCKKS